MGGQQNIIPGEDHLDEVSRRLSESNVDRCHCDGELQAVLYNAAALSMLHSHRRIARTNTRGTGVAQKLK